MERHATPWSVLSCDQHQRVMLPIGGYLARQGAAYYGRAEQPTQPIRTRGKQGQAPWMALPLPAHPLLAAIVPALLAALRSDRRRHRVGGDRARSCGLLPVSRSASTGGTLRGSLPPARL